MLKDVIWDSIKSYGWVIKYASIASIPILAVVYMFSYVLYTLSKNMDDNIFLLIIVGGCLILGAFIWVWIDILNYLDDNDKI